MTNKQVALIVLGIIATALIACGYVGYLWGIGVLAFFTLCLDD